MADRIVEVADGFWNIRGSFKIAGLLDIGTQMSLVRRANGRFLLLDSYEIGGSVLDEVMALTDGGEAVDAVLNLHPFHTVHVAATHAQFPNATLVGASRHRDLAPDLPWHALTIDHPDLHAAFADDLDFMVPAGVDFISDDPKLHFSSVLAFHRASRVLHVDDTLTYVPVPIVGGLGFHPTLAKTLEKRAGAAAAFRAWALELAARCDQVDHVCTAHMRTLPPVPAPFGDQVRTALSSVESTLAKHEARWG